MRAISHLSIVSWRPIVHMEMEVVSIMQGASLSDTVRCPRIWLKAMAEVSIVSVHLSSPTVQFLATKASMVEVYMLVVVQRLPPVRFPAIPLPVAAVLPLEKVPG